MRSLWFYSHLFLVPKPHQKWRAFMDLNRLNVFLLVERFKMETPESIRASDSRGMMSIDQSDTYLHIPIHPTSRKYLRFPSTVHPVHLPPFWSSQGPTYFYNDCKESEADGPSPIPRRLIYQAPVSGGGTNEHSDGGGPNRVDNQSREVLDGSNLRI